MEITRTHSLTFTGVLSESRRIIKSNPSHFLTLSLLFLPLSISLIVSPSLHPYLPRHQLLHPSPPNPHPNIPPNPNNNNNFPSLHNFIYLLLVSTLSLIATSLITRSSHLTFLNNNNNLPTTTLNSLFPLAFTAFLSHVLMFLAFVTFLMLVGLLFMLLQTVSLSFGFSFAIDYNSVYFTQFSVILSVVLVIIYVYFYVNWLLAYVIVVTESKWGFSALVRSVYLVNGMRSVALKLLLFYGVLGAVLVTVYSSTVIGYGLGSWAFWLNVMFGSGFLMLLMMQSSVANVVLYNYCKAVHGELVIEIDDGFGLEYGYVGLGVGDEKVPHVVTVVTA